MNGVKILLKMVHLVKEFTNYYNKQINKNIIRYIIVGNNTEIKIKNNKNENRNSKVLQ